MFRTGLVSFILSVGLLAYALGMLSVQQEWYAWRVVKDAHTNLNEFIKGHDEERATSPLEKIVSDNGGIPYRELRPNVRKYDAPKGAKKFQYNKNGIALQGYYTQQTPPGYFLISGAFNFKGRYNTGYVLISSKGKLIHYWVRGGEMMVTVDEKRKQFMSEHYARPWCSKTHELGSYRIHDIHHSIEMAPDGTYWANNEKGFVQYDPDKLSKRGRFKVIRSIGLEEIVNKNKEISPLNARLRIKWKKRKNQRGERMVKVRLYDPYHHNDVQPFVDPRFPTKLGYALLISIRHQNLVAVVDPTTAEILWFVQGVTEWQHDADYHDGYVYLYDNGPFRGYSRLIRIPLDPSKNPNRDYEVVIDGRKHDWRQTMRGYYSVVEYNNQLFFPMTYERDAAVIMYNERSKPVFVVQSLLNSNTKHGVHVYAVEYITPESFAALEKGCKR